MKRFILLSLVLCGIPVSAHPALQWWQHLSKGERCAAAVCVGIGAWALIERYAKNTYATQRDVLAKRVQVTQSEVDKLKSEEYQLEADKRF